MNKYPKIVISLLVAGDGWIIGSASDPNSINFRDVDIFIPHANWHKVSSMIPTSAQPNSFGGWKFVIDGTEIDLWPDSLERLMDHTNTFYQPHTGKLFKLERRYNQ